MMASSMHGDGHELAEVIIHDPQGATETRRLRGRGLLFGRSTHCDVQMTGHHVSRNHAELISDPFGRWWIRDLDSHNGTTVNGALITEHLLEPGDLITIGEWKIEVAGPTRPASEDIAAPTLLEPRTTAGVVDVAQQRVTTLGETQSTVIDRRHLNHLIEFGRQLMNREGADARLQALCDLIAGEVFHGHDALVLSVDRQRASEEPQVLAQSKGRAPFPMRRHYVSKSLMARVAADPQPVLASNKPLESGDHELSLSPEVAEVAIMACPISVNEEFVVALYGQFSPSFGSEEWLAMMSLAVDQYRAADQVWNTRLVVRKQRQIEHDLSRAREIQDKLLPDDHAIKAIDVAVGFEPCRWVAGDYVDLVETPGGRVLIAIADATGKGLQASLIASSVHSITHASVTMSMSLIDTMHALNQYLLRYLPDGSFVTMLAMMLDPQTGNIECVNAGHPPAIAVARDGNVRRIGAVPGFPLGVVDEPYELQTDTLAPRELMCLYTDGLTEVRGDQGNMLGDGGLEQVVAKLWAELREPGQPDPPAAVICQRLSGELDRFQSGRMQMDDRTFLVASHGGDRADT